MGRIAKWALELMGQGIVYASWMAIMSQVLADFIAEWTEVQMPPEIVDQEYWTMYFDGSLMKQGVGMGLVFILPLGVCMRYMVRIHFPPQTMWLNMRRSSMAYASPSSWASDASTSEATPSWSSAKS